MNKLKKKTKNWLLHLALTPKAIELLNALKPGHVYSMSGMGDLIFNSPKTHTRQAIALKASRFARQLLDESYLSYNSDNLYYITALGMRSDCLKKEFSSSEIIEQALRIEKT